MEMLLGKHAYVCVHVQLTVGGGWARKEGPPLRPWTHTFTHFCSTAGNSRGSGSLLCMFLGAAKAASWGGGGRAHTHSLVRDLLEDEVVQ